jgi:hypothetical protein
MSNNYLQHKEISSLLRQKTEVILHQLLCKERIYGTMYIIQKAKITCRKLHPFSVSHLYAVLDSMLLLLQPKHRSVRIQRLYQFIKQKTKSKKSNAINFKASLLKTNMNSDSKTPRRHKSLGKDLCGRSNPLIFAICKQLNHTIIT